MRVKVTRLMRREQRLGAIFMLGVAACSVSFNVNEAMRYFFLAEEGGKASSSLELRSMAPIAWEKLCLVYFPYASQFHIEEKYQGKILGEYKSVGDANWMLLGITGNNEITQVVLDLEVSKYLGEHFRPVASSSQCVSRANAVLVLEADGNGERYVRLGNP